MSQEELLQILKDAWMNLDSKELEKHIHEEFTYDSQWVLGSMSAEEYRLYIQGKFKSIKKSGSFVEIEEVRDPYSHGNMLCLKQGKNIAYLRIRVKDNKISKMDMCMF